MHDFGTDEEIEALNERAVGWKPFGPFDLFSDATHAGPSVQSYSCCFPSRWRYRSGDSY